MNSATTALIFLSIAYGFLYFFVEIFYQVLTYRSHIIRLTIMQIVITLIIIGLNLLFLCWFGWGVSGLMAGQVIGLFIVFIIALKAYFQESCHLHFDFKQSLHTCFIYVKMGLPFVPSMILAWLLSSSDRWFLTRYASLHDTGIYALASVVGQLFQMMVVLPVMTAYTPYMLKKFADNKQDLLAVERWNHRNMVYSMVGLTIVVTLGYFVCKPLLYLFLPPRYQQAVQYIWWIVMGYIFLLGEQFAAIFVVYNKKIYFQSASFIIPSILNVILNMLLIPYFNIYGCVIATLITYMVHFSIKLAYNIHLRNKIATGQTP